ncbi:hypothetical protein SSX86_020701 [Deinandra increscens subsp. villosa]|uniref:Uncharacterized protein n=1 Tax=Deinandra increscens subsp. villosa TaxID=3103831 RepID=A0AAP0GTH4_9ASTR
MNDDKGKSVKSEQDNPKFVSDSNYFESPSDLPCKKHPSNSSSVGICAFCLKEKLIELVSLDCGEQRKSSCSFSDLSSYRNSSCTVDIASIGSVGRFSILIENEKGGNGDDQKTLISDMKLKQGGTETEDVVLLKRSNSCVVEVKKSNGFWRIGKLFKKRREKDGFSERNRGFDQKNEVRSSGGLSATVSDFNKFDSRKSGVIDFKGGFAVKESDFSRIGDDDEFIDLKIDLSDKSKTEHSVFKKNDPLEGCGIGSSSCRIMVNERGIKKVKNSHMKAWKWGFKHYSRKKE